MFLKAFIFENSVNQLTEKYFKHLKTKNFMIESSCLCCKGQFSNISSRSHKLFLLVEKSRIGTDAHEKIVSLQCFERNQSVVRENSCEYFLFFHIYFLFLLGSAWITTCVVFKTTYLILVKTSSGCRR